MTEQDNNTPGSNRVTIEDARRVFDDQSLDPFRTNANVLYEKGGKRGSITTWQKHLNAIRAERISKAVQPVTVKPPVEALEAIWTAAVGAAGFELCKRIELVSKERDVALAQSSVDAADSVASLEACDEQRARAETAEQRAATAEVALRETDIKLAAIQDNERKLQSRVEEQAADIGVLKHELDRWQREVEQMRQQSLSELIRQS